MRTFIYIIILLPFTSFGQSYTSFFTGNATDKITSPSGGVCLMGGAIEDDNAMKWFLKRANGGDVLVLRTSGSNGYNNYLYATLGIPVNSVETIVCNNATASKDPYVVRKIQQAEAIWFAGGDQWKYISYWRNTPVDSLIDLALTQRNIVIGGNSAGMAIQGKYYFSAQNGTVTSAAALANPYNDLVTLDSAAFIKNKLLGSVITDTHFDNPNRKGRLTTFLAKIFADYGVQGKAIACDEYTAVCIDTNGIARVFGGFPAEDDNAYFIQTNCELTNQLPENCSNGTPLNWNRDGKALKVYQVKGTSTGDNVFNLNNWQSGSGGTWLHWSVNNGTFVEQVGDQISCVSLTINEADIANEISVYPNPASEEIAITCSKGDLTNYAILLFGADGKRIPIDSTTIANNQVKIQLSTVVKGIYFLKIEANGITRFSGKIIKH